MGNKPGGGGGGGGNGNGLRRSSSASPGRPGTGNGNVGAGSHHSEGDGAEPGTPGKTRGILRTSSRNGAPTPPGAGAAIARTVSASSTASGGGHAPRPPTTPPPSAAGRASLLRTHHTAPAAVASASNAATASTTTTDEWTAKGAYVEAKLDSWSRWYGGEIKGSKKLPNGTTVFDVLFDDGERIHDVPLDKMRPPPTRKPGAFTPLMDAQPMRFQVGDRVSAKIPGWAQWYDGNVTHRNEESSTYVVEFDDGEIVSTVRDEEMIRVHVAGGGPDDLRQLPDFCKVGGRIEAKVPGWRKFYPGTLRSVDEKTGMWTVLFDDGELRTDVSVSMMRSGRASAAERVRFVEEDGTELPPPTTTTTTTTAAPSGGAASVVSKKSSFSSMDPNAGLVVGARVLANPKGEWSRAYPGTIERVLEDGTVSILFDDGDRVSNVELVGVVLMRARAETGQGPSNEGEAPVTVGMLVECKVGGWRKWYPGKVQHVNADGTYKVHFLDGEIVEAVKKAEIRQPRQRAETTATDVAPATSDDGADVPVREYNVNDRVAAKLPSWRRWWGGYVTGKQKDPDGGAGAGASWVYEITFDDGEVYSGVPPQQMRVPDANSHLAHPELIRPAVEEFRVGERVEARLTELGWRAWYPGIITAKTEELEEGVPVTHYAIQFDDGERFHDILAHEIRRVVKVT